jgi:O-methyltransferase involved in polyketide biosynthesis
MSEISLQNLSDVAETPLMMLYIRAVESQRPDGLIKDEKAVALARQMDQDFLRNKLTKIDEETRVAIILRNRKFDRYARDFLGRHPEAVVVHIGCGLDSRFERVCSEQPDNGQVEWYDLDLPDVIALRRPALGCTHSCSACSRLFCSGRAALWQKRVS